MVIAPRHGSELAVALLAYAIAMPIAWAAPPDMSSIGPSVRRAVDVDVGSPSRPLDDDLREESPALRQRLQAIRRDIALHPADPWVGDYRAYWLEVLVSPAGAVAICRGHMGICATNEGPIRRASDGTLRIRWNQPNDGEYARFPDQLLPLRWGARRYVLVPSRIGDFVDQINGGYEPRTLYGGSTLFAEGDFYRPVDGNPELPGRYRAAIRTRPLTARILDVRPLPERTYNGGTECRKVFGLRLSVVGGTPRVHDVFHPTVPADVVAVVAVERIDGDGIGAVARIETNDCQNHSLSTPDRSWVLETHVFDPANANRTIEKRRLEDLP